jgi:hypothetical protein
MTLPTGKLPHMVVHLLGFCQDLAISPKVARKQGQKTLLVPAFCRFGGVAEERSSVTTNTNHHH